MKKLRFITILLCVSCYLVNAQSDNNKESNFQLDFKNGSFLSEGVVPMDNYYAEDIEYYFLMHNEFFRDFVISEKSEKYPYEYKGQLILPPIPLDGIRKSFSCNAHFIFEDNQMLFHIKSPQLGKTSILKGFYSGKSLDKMIKSFPTKNKKQQQIIKDFETEFNLYIDKVITGTKSKYRPIRKKVNTVPLSIIARSSLFKKARGWYLDKSREEWVARENAIDCAFDYNMRDIRFIKILYKNNPWYILVTNSATGYYKYPNIQKEWVTNNSCHFYVFSPEDYKKACNNHTGFTLSSKRYGSTPNTFNMGRLVTEIKKALDNEETIVEKKFIVQYTNENTVKFLLPYIDSSLNIDNAYFEGNISDFKQLFTLE